MSDNGDTTRVLCNVTVKNGGTNVYFNPKASPETLALAVHFLNKQFGEMTDKLKRPQQSPIVSVSPDVMNRIRGK